MPYKQRAIVYGKRDGAPRVEYWVVDDNGTITTCAPSKWLRVNLPDETTPESMAEAAKLRLEATRWKQFNKRVEDNALCRQKPEGEDAYIFLCKHHSIAF